jgi:hypothetical protein
LVQLPVVQVPQAPHTELQQRLPTQLPEVHSPPTVQGEPLGLVVPQLLLTQKSPAAQLVLPVHELGQEIDEPSQR